MYKILQKYVIWKWLKFKFLWRNLENNGNLTYNISLIQQTILLKIKHYVNSSAWGKFGFKHR